MSWYALMTAPQREFKAAEALRERGYIVFVPWTERKKGKQEAFFKSYVFVHRLIPWREMNWRDDRCIRDKHGNQLLIGAVTVCGVQEAIPEEIVAKIATDAAMERLAGTQDNAPLLKVGDVGILKSGAFEGKQGKVVAISKGEAEVALKIFNAVRIVRTKIDALEAA